MTFAQKVLHSIQPGNTVLDLGAGNGWFAQECLMRQAVVTAVDMKVPQKRQKDIDWHIMKVEDFVMRLPASRKFDIIFCRNLLQFLDRQWVQEQFFPFLVKHLQFKGIIAVQTFYRNPDPPFVNALPSLFTIGDLKNVLADLQIVHERELVETMKDMQGTSRTFFVTNIIAQF